MKESDYYRHRDKFPADWEDTFQLKDYYFYIGEKTDMRGLNDDGTEFTYKNGYWLVKVISAMDTRQFYEKTVCKHYGWDKDYTWENGIMTLDCDAMFVRNFLNFLLTI